LSSELGLVYCQHQTELGTLSTVVEPDILLGGYIMWQIQTFDWGGTSCCGSRHSATGGI